MKDTERTLYCPACGKEMTKIYITSAKCNVDVCLDGCGGIYFDNREFQKMDENAENIQELYDAVKDREFEKVDTTKARMCPDCNHVMVKNFASAKQEIEIDQCYTCGGIFLDCNELFQIRDQFKTEQDRIDHFNQKFLDKFGEFEPLSPDAQKRVDHVQKIGSLVNKLFGK